MPSPKPRRNEQINPFWCRCELAHRQWTIDRWAAELHYRQRATPYLSRVLGYSEVIGSSQGRRFVAVLSDVVRGDRLDSTLHDLWHASGRPPVLAWYEGVVGVQWPAKLDSEQLGVRLIAVGVALAESTRPKAASAQSVAQSATKAVAAQPRLKLVQTTSQQRPGFRRTA